ncbi:hypothetical protein [Paraburkholderia fungorum]
MKNIRAAALSTLASATMLLAGPAPAWADQWTALANTLYVLPPAEGVKIYLGASIDSRTHDVAINVFDLTGRVCKDGEDSPVQPATPISIDGKFVKFQSACINGMHIVQPATDVGKRFLNSEVASGRSVTIDTGEGPALHYPGTNLAAVRAKLIAARDAM